MKLYYNLKSRLQVPCGCNAEKYYKSYSFLICTIGILFMFNGQSFQKGENVLLYKTGRFSK